MRDIKFRAWDPNKKQMFIDFDQSIKEVLLGRSIHQFVYETGLLYGTLMQFTGFKDFFGHEIYEGDILDGADGSYPYGETYNITTVEYYNGAFGFTILYDMEFISFHQIDDNKMEEFQVVGNIYQNPEMIK